MTETAFVRGESGVIFLMDVPAEGSQPRDQYDQRFEKGDWSLVPDDEVDTVEVDGATRYVQRAPVEAKSKRTKSTDEPEA